MTDREKIINAIEKAKKQSEEYAQDRIIVPFKEADMILALLKEQEAQFVLSNRVCEVEPFRYVRKGFCPKCHQGIEWLFNRKHCGFCGQEVKWE